MARPKGPRKVYRYTDEFKLKAVKLTELPGVQVKDVAQALDIHPWMLSLWRTRAKLGAFSKAKRVSFEVGEREEVRELAKVKRELALCLYAAHKLTIVQAADVAQLGLFEFQALLRDRRIPQHYDSSNLDQDLLSLRELPPRWHNWARFGVV